MPLSSLGASAVSWGFQSLRNRWPPWPPLASSLVGRPRGPLTLASLSYRLQEDPFLTSPDTLGPAEMTSVP